MGTIASVLQWTCTNCNLINPTECLKCLKCGNVRKILEGGGAGGGGALTPADGVYVDTSAGDGGDDAIAGTGHLPDRCRAAIVNNNGENGVQNDRNNGVVIGGAKAATIGELATDQRVLQHKTLPGYVEISSNG